MVDLHSLYLKPSLFCAPIVFPHFLTQCFVISFRMCQNQYGGWMRTQTQDGGGISKMCPKGKKKKHRRKIFTIKKGNSNTPMEEIHTHKEMTTQQETDGQQSTAELN